MNKQYEEFEEIIINIDTNEQEYLEIDISKDIESLYFYINDDNINNEEININIKFKKII